jgi:hypothetical protein
MRSPESHSECRTYVNSNAVGVRGESELITFKSWELDQMLVEIARADICACDVERRDAIRLYVNHTVLVLQRSFDA